MSPLQKVRCPSCGGSECGWDAYSAFNPVTQDTELGGEYDDGWCSNCGDLDPEFYTPEGDELAELERQIAEHVKAERIRAAGPDLLTALTRLLTFEGDLLVTPDAIEAIAQAAAAIHKATKGTP